MKLADIGHQLFDGRSRQAEANGPDYCQTVLEDPRRLGHRISLATRGCERVVKGLEKGACPCKAPSLLAPSQTSRPVKQ
jgi:hypothetical protein